MNLTIDIGNTRAKVVAFDGERIADHFCTGHDLSGVKEFSARMGCQKGIFSTTARMTPEGNQVLGSLGFPMHQLTGNSPVPISVQYHTTETLGADRLAAIVGARTLLPEGHVLVIDSGTCLTYDFLDTDNHYLGGNIAPGLEMRLKAMHEHTAALPLIGREGEAPELGYDTATALRSGVVWGMKFEIEGYLTHFMQKYPGLSVFLTGGDVKKLGISKEFTNFASETVQRGTIMTDEFLVPRGLNKALEGLPDEKSSSQN